MSDVVGAPALVDGDAPRGAEDVSNVGDVVGAVRDDRGAVERLREENKRLSALNTALVGTHNFYLVESSKWQSRAEALEAERAQITPSSLVCCKCWRSWNWIKRDGECGRTDYENPCPTIERKTPTQPPQESADSASSSAPTVTSALTRSPTPTP